MSTTSAHHASTRPRSPSIAAYDTFEQDYSDPVVFHTTAITEDAHKQSFSSPATKEKTSDSYPLHNCWIFDTGADTHITNDVNRFIGPLRQTDRKTQVYSRNTFIDVHGYGDARINLTDPRTNQQRIVILRNTAYIPSFHTNIVSGFNARRHNIFPDIENMELYYRNPTTNTRSRYAKLFAKERILLLENNYVEPSIIYPQAHFSLTIPVATAELDLWHKRLGHASVQVIKHLPTATRRAAISPSQSENAPCSTWTLTKAKKQISRVPFDEPTCPFDRVHVDLMFFEPGYNKHTVAFHLYDPFTGFHLVTTGTTKTIFNSALKEFVNLIERQFGYTIRVLVMNGERTFDNSTRQFISSKGIIISITAPETPEQNGPGERSGQTFTIIGRGFRIEGRLTSSLWPELIKTGVYIANRTPIQRRQYTTPYELVFKQKPRVHHLRIIGCTAYVKDTKIKQTHKLHPRAHIGYLVRYSASTIFHIWVPHLNRIIRSRDVTFDETRFSDPLNPFPDESIRKSIDLTLPDVEAKEDDFLIAQQLDNSFDFNTDDSNSQSHPSDFIPYTNITQPALIPSLAPAPSNGVDTKNSPTEELQPTVPMEDISYDNLQQTSTSDIISQQPSTSSTHDISLEVPATRMEIDTDIPPAQPSIYNQPPLITPQSLTSPEARILNENDMFTRLATDQSPSNETINDQSPPTVSTLNQSNQPI